MKLSFRVVSAVLAVGLSGCGASKTAVTPENLKAGLTKYLAGKRLDCLFAADQRFPYESTTAAEQKRLDVMVAEQMLTVKRAPPIARYDVTPYGASQAPQFCYGERQVTSVDSWTPLEKVDRFNQTTVTYHYSMENVPVWAKSAEMKQAFPAMAQATSGNAVAQTAMAQTAVGWLVPE